MGRLSPENHDSLVYEFEELFERPVSNTEKVIDLKQRLIDDLQTIKNLQFITFDKIRLRERNSDSLGTVFSNFIHIRYHSLKDNV